MQNECLCNTKIAGNRVEGCFAGSSALKLLELLALSSLHASD
jgi:hypothetical protein